MLKQTGFVAATLMLLASHAFAAEPDQGLRQYNVETSTSVDVILNQLAPRLPESVVAMEINGGTALSYTGNKTPIALSAFLTSAFDDLDPAIIAMGQTVSLTTTLSKVDSGTSISLMVLARFAAPEAVPADARVLMDGRGRGECEGQLVLSQPSPRADAAKAYLARFEAEGFAFPDTARQETSFFIGYRDDCEVSLYLQDDNDASLVVIQYLKD